MKSAATVRGCATAITSVVLAGHRLSLSMMTIRSISLYLPGRPYAREPKRMIFSTLKFSTMRLTMPSIIRFVTRWR